MAKAKRAQKTTSKSTFIRQYPDLSVEEVVAKAKEEGLSILPNLVYKVRGRAKARAFASAPIAKRGRPPRIPEARDASSGPVSREPASPRSGDIETAFRKLVLELGLQRAKALLAEVEDKLHALVAGR